MRPARRILVVGGESQLGAALASAHARRGDKVKSTTRRRIPAARNLFLDLATVPDRWKPPAGTEVAYLCAGITSLQACEAAPEDTARVNVGGTLEVCRALARAGVFVVFFSTNLVFDGEEPSVEVNAPASPRCAYGRQKAAVETALRDENIPGVVIRLSKVIDRTHALLDTWRSALQRGEGIAPFTDMTMAPVTLESVVAASVAAAEGKTRGTVHLSASRDITYFEAARHVAKRLGARDELVRAHTARATLGAGRFIPRHTTLAASAHPAVSFTPPDPLAAIDACLAEPANRPGRR